jgi:hypothetical protein
MHGSYVSQGLFSSAATVSRVRTDAGSKTMSAQDKDAGRRKERNSWKPWHMR